MDLVDPEESFSSKCGTLPVLFPQAADVGDSSVALEVQKSPLSRCEHMHWIKADEIRQTNVSSVFDEHGLSGTTPNCISFLFLLYSFL